MVGVNKCELGVINGNFCLRLRGYVRVRERERDMLVRRWLRMGFW